MLTLRREDGLFKNVVLSRLDPRSIERLHLEPVLLEMNKQVTRSGASVRRLLFLEQGIASLNVSFQDGTQVEAGLLGCETVLGVACLVGQRQTPYETVMRTAGQGFSCSLEDATREFGRFQLFHDLALECLQTQLAQTIQLSGCNAKHEVVQRLCRWLLLCHDRVAPADIYITQEALGNALGVRRTTVTMGMETLRSWNLIQYRRGRIHILDRTALKHHACECYDAMRDRNPSPKNFTPGLQLSPVLKSGTVLTMTSAVRRGSEPHSPLPIQ